MRHYNVDDDFNEEKMITAAGLRDSLPIIDKQTNKQTIIEDGGSFSLPVVAFT